MPRKKKTIEKPVLIAVEGVDYLYFLLSQIVGVIEFEDIQLWDFATNDFAASLQLLKDERGFDELVRSLGVIRDAEANRAAMEASTQQAFKNHGLSVPGAAQIVVAGSPKVGYLIIPHDEQSGCLEHACLKASCLPKAQVECSEIFLQCVSRHHDKPLNTNHQAKLKVHATIAGSGQHAALTLGESAKAGLWDFNHPSLKVMLDFMRMMRDA